MRKHGAKIFQNVHIANEKKNRPARLPTTIPMIVPVDKEPDPDAADVEPVSELFDVAVATGAERVLCEVVLTGVNVPVVVAKVVAGAPAVYPFSPQ